MPNIASAYSTPATVITTTAETLAQNIPPTPLALPGGAPQNVIIRGGVLVTTGVAGTSVTVKLRVGQTNTTTAQVAQSETTTCAASTLSFIPFHFIDTVPGNLVASGYSITVIQNAATGNGAVTAVDYEVATTP